MDRQPLRVLIVVNSNDDASPIIEELRQRGIDPLSATASHREDLKRALDDDQWELVLCDCDSPDLKPCDALEMIRELGKEIPLLVMASPEREATAHKALREGADDCVIKGSFHLLDIVIPRVLRAARDRADLRGARKALEFIGDVSRIARSTGSLEATLSRVATFIPRRWPYSDIACASVRIDGRTYRPERFAETPWRLACEITVHGIERGEVEVFRENPGSSASGEEPFRKEEKQLMEELAHHIGSAVERVSAEEKAGYLNTVLRTLRNVSRRMVTVEDAAMLVEQVCREIVSTRGLKRAWVYLNHDAPGGEMTLDSGWGDSFQSLSEYLKGGQIPPCCEKALSLGQVVTTQCPLSNCVDCPLSTMYDNGDQKQKEALTATIRIDEKAYGFMCVAVSPDPAVAEEKESLLQELSDDIAFALRRIEVECERDRVETDLKAEAMRRRVLMNASMDGICVLNQDHEVVESNQRFAEMLGYTQEELRELHTWDFEANMSEAEIRASFADLTQTYAIFETRHRRKDGALYDVEVSASGARVGNEPMVFTVSRDITEKKKMQANLAQSDRLSSMGMLAAGVAHEINNPLAYVLYHLKTLSKELPRLEEPVRRCRERLDARLRKGERDPLIKKLDDTLRCMRFQKITSRFQEALEGTLRIQEIARALSTFSRVERQQLAPVDIHYTLECAINMAFNEIKYRARLIEDFGVVQNVMASEGHLSQVFLNLLINAAHAVEEGSVEENEIRVRTWQEEEDVCVEVSDNGKGIPKDLLDRIYEPFFTTKSVGVGSGLGLTISKNIVTGYGGRIDVESTQGEGTRFVIRIPVRQPQAEMAPARKEHPSEPAAYGRILVIDDEVGILNTLRDMLEGHDVVTAQSGKIGKEIVEKGNRFDVILCDMMMPVMSGMEFHEWLRKADPCLAEKLIFITGGAFTPVARDYLAKVGNICLNKPFDEELLTREVSERIAARRKSQHPRSE